MLLDVRESMTPSQLVSEINRIMECSKIFVEEKTSHSHKIKKHETKEAFKLFQKYKTEFFKNVYFSLRKNMSREILLNKRRIREEKIAKLVQSAQSEGIRGLYPAGPSSAQVSLSTWESFFSNLYQTLDEPEFPSIPVVPNKEALELLSPFTESEIEAALNHQSSKAPALSGVSPTNLKAVASILSSWSQYSMMLSNSLFSFRMIG